MKSLAQCIHRFGPPDVIQFEMIELERPARGEALIRISAAGVGPWDALIRSGQSALPQPLPLTLGSDFSGVIIDIGEDAGDFRVGDEVFGITNTRFIGAYAHHALVHTSGIARKPKIVDFIGAAALPVVAVTAWKMLFERGRLECGERVLIHGAAGSVGALAVQLAVHAGATVISVARSADRDALRSNGATEVHSYDVAPFEDVIEPVDLVLDTIGGEVQTRSFAVLKRGGRLISIVAPPNPQLAVHYGVRAEFFVVEVKTADLERIARLIEAGELTAHVGLTLPLAEARQAHVLLEHPKSGRRGKIVLWVDHSAAGAR